MIKNEELGVEIAENEEEEIWSQAVTDANKNIAEFEKAISDYKKAIKINKAALSVFEKNLKKAGS